MEKGGGRRSYTLDDIRAIKPLLCGWREEDYMVRMSGVGWFTAYT